MGSLGIPDSERIGIIGPTGRVGRYVVYKLAHKSFPSVSPSASSPSSSPSSVSYSSSSSSSSSSSTSSSSCHPVYDLTLFVRDPSHISSCISPLFSPSTSLPSHVHVSTSLDLSDPDTIRPELFQGLDRLIIASGAVYWTKIGEVLGWRKKGKGHPEVVELESVRKIVDIVSRPESSVKQVVLVSSVGVTNPYYYACIMLNALLSMVIKYKYECEQVVREKLGGRSDKFYTIIRPAGLVKDPIFLTPYNKQIDTKKASASVDDPSAIVHSRLRPYLCQGDHLRGRICHDDVAEVIVQSLLQPQSRNATIEVAWKQIPEIAVSSSVTYPAGPYPRYVREAFHSWEVNWGEVKEDREPLPKVNHAEPFYWMMVGVTAISVMAVVRWMGGW